jgi:hypothetical protein
MDWSNERYVRLYVRDTTTWKLLGWQGQTVLMHLLRKLDRAGRLDFEGCTAAEAVALHTGLPEEVVSKGWDAVTKRHVFVTDDLGVLMPHYLEAQEAVQSNAQRTREWRARQAAGVTKRDEPQRNVTEPLRAVTDGDGARRSVTDGDSSRAVPCRAVPSEPAGPAGAREESVLPPPDFDLQTVAQIFSAERQAAGGKGWRRTHTAYRALEDAVGWAMQERPQDPEGAVRASVQGYMRNADKGAKARGFPFNFWASDPGSWLSASRTGAVAAPASGTPAEPDDFGDLA